MNWGLKRERVGAQTANLCVACRYVEGNILDGHAPLCQRLACCMLGCRPDGPMRPRAGCCDCADSRRAGGSGEAPCFHQVPLGLEPAAWLSGQLLLPEPGGRARPQHQPQLRSVGRLDPPCRPSLVLWGSHEPRGQARLWGPQVKPTSPVWGAASVLTAAHHTHTGWTARPHCLVAFPV